MIKRGSTMRMRRFNSFFIGSTFFLTSLLHMPIL